VYQKRNKYVVLHLTDMQEFLILRYTKRRDPDHSTLMWGACEK